MTKLLHWRLTTTHLQKDSEKMAFPMSSGNRMKQVSLFQLVQFTEPSDFPIIVWNRAQVLSLLSEFKTILIPLLASSSRVKNAYSFSSTSHLVFKPCCTFTFTFSWYCYVLCHQCLCARLCLDIRGRFVVLNTFSLTNHEDIGQKRIWTVLVL
jgi:hypothetical protein